MNPGVQRATRRRWLWTGAVLPVGAVALMLWLGRERWEPVPAPGPGAKWTKGYITRTDRNGDGVVDEEETRLPGEGNAIIRRDTNRDGFFDVRYELRSGVVVRIETIREPAPRH